MKPLALLLGFALFLLMPTSVAAADCQFVLGFKTLRDLIGHDNVGECLENEHHNATGDSVQQTTGGLLVWRKADNWTAFTDGYRTWLNGPNGLEQRLNTERFEWEADYAPGGGIATPTPTPTPAATATPIPAITPSPTAVPTPETATSLAELAKASAWYRDGLDHAHPSFPEPRAVGALQDIDRNNPQFARVMSGWAWIFDGEMSLPEVHVIEYIADLGKKWPEFAAKLVAFPWIQDGVDLWESEAAGTLYSVASAGNRDFAEELATAPWISDGVNVVEVVLGMSSLDAMSGHQQIAHSSPELARRFLRLVTYPPKEIDLFLVDALANIALLNPDGFERLLRAQWFVDGLDEEERVYLIAAGGSDLNADQLFEPYSVTSSRVVLTHSGARNLWVVHRLPSETGQIVLENLDRAVRGSDHFWELPFPVENVILSLLEQDRGAHLGRMMALSTMLAKSKALYHETAHYYFKEGPSWFAEGGAELVRLYLTYHGRIPSVEHPEYCREQGLNKIQVLNELDGGPLWDRCRYPMGLHFLVSLREIMGERAWIAALRDFYLEFGYAGLHVTTQDSPGDEYIYRLFMEHAPLHLKTEVRDLFKRLHGGPFLNE